MTAARAGRAKPRTRCPDCDWTDEDDGTPLVTCSDCAKRNKSSAEAERQLRTEDLDALALSRMAEEEAEQADYERRMDAEDASRESKP